MPQSKSIIIQEEIKVSEDFVKKTIEHYRELTPNFALAFGDFIGNKDAIIKELEALSPIGKQILLLRYKFDAWLNKQERKHDTSMRRRVRKKH